jgi:hypothetical protein
MAQEVLSMIRAGIRLAMAILAKFSGFPPWKSFGDRVYEPTLPLF